MSAIAAWVASIAPTASLSMVKTSGLIPNGSLPPCGRCGCKAGTTSGCGRHCHVGECGRPGRMRGVTTATPSYKGHRYPVETINHCVWLYFRFPLSFREVEELMMLVRGVAVSYETTGGGAPSSGRPTPTSCAGGARARRQVAPRRGVRRDQRQVAVPVARGRQARQRARRSRPVTPKRGGGQAILP